MLNFKKIIDEELFEDTLEEVSTSAGSGAYLTKYAFGKGEKAKVPKYMLKAGYKKVEEGIVTKPKGAGNLPKYKQTDVKLGHLKTNEKGVEKPSQYLNVGYKLVDRKKLAKNSKGVDYVDLNNTAYK